MENESDRGESSNRKQSRGLFSKGADNLGGWFGVLAFALWLLLVPVLLVESAREHSPGLADLMSDACASAVAFPSPTPTATPSALPSPTVTPPSGSPTRAQPIR